MTAGLLVTEIVVLGAGGDGLVVAEAIRQSSHAGHPMRLIGFLDDARPAPLIDGLPVFGGLGDWHRLGAEVRFVPAIQKVRDMPRRADRLERLAIPRDRWATVIHPSAVVARDAQIGIGVYIAACATIQPGCRIGDFASVRGGAALGHDATVERHAYVGPNATMCGRTRLSEGAHLGPNAVILDGLAVGRYAVVGIGAAVTRAVPDFAVVMGNPARRVGAVRPLQASTQDVDGELRGTTT